MAMGTATANSILVVSHALERIKEHGDRLLAAIEAGKARIRPVLMTAGAMIMGMLPMALGGSTNAPLGRAVIGGLMFATVYTLFFVPCMYAITYTRSVPKDKESVPGDKENVPGDKESVPGVRSDDVVASAAEVRELKTRILQLERVLGQENPGERDSHGSR
jgi:predicted RND superfamily exporter protein